MMSNKYGVKFLSNNQFCALLRNFTPFLYLKAYFSQQNYRFA